MPNDHPMRGRATGLAALTIAALLGGCSVGEAYRRPDTPTPPAWTEWQGAAGEWPSADWWRSFNAPRLDDYMQGAAQANLDIAAAVARVRQADAQARIAGAPLLPSLDLAGGVSRSQTPTLRKTSGSGNTNPVLATTYSATLSTGYEIDFWGKNAAARDSAEAAARASRYDGRTVALTVQAGVATTYFDIVGLQDRLAVARGNLANAEEVLAAIRDRLAAGTATDLDLAQQEAEVATTQATVPPLEQQLRQDANVLALLVGKLPEEVAIQPNALASIAVPPVAAGLPSELLTRRPDVRSAEEQLVAANADMASARAALFPSIRLTGQYGFESLALDSLFNPGSTLWSLASSVSQPIFHGGALEGETELRRGRYDELVANYRKAVISAFSDVENALVAVRKTTEEEQAQRRAESTARRAYDIALAQLRGGVVDITAVLNTQKALFQAEDALVQAKLAHLQAVVSLFKALGGGWDGTL